MNLLIFKRKKNMKLTEFQIKMYKVEEAILNILDSEKGETKMSVESLMMYDPIGVSWEEYYKILFTLYKAGIINLVGIGRESGAAYIHLEKKEVAIKHYNMLDAKRVAEIENAPCLYDDPEEDFEIRPAILKAKAYIERKYLQDKQMVSKRDIQRSRCVKCNSETIGEILESLESEDAISCEKFGKITYYKPKL